ncbi:HAD-IB family phosphatase [Egicoccus halophilus]|uniref:Haloacid dehalogenase n=1 Tax=Egicoccus halophilus TaxID=1670830 RepID=A0A8J3ESX7_9ACTN|nr:HAD-IB family phosphatase [Egicoccus halophilus]GGI02545.1 haloacid dehalogenase [Egicoccus halophilus]
MGIAQQLAGTRVGVTGGTGFVGQALLARMLEDLPDTPLVLFVRGRGRRSARQRVERLFASGSAFATARERGLVEAALARTEVVDVDLDAPADQSLVLPAVDVLLHVAGTVSFDTRIDEAFRTHTTGVDRLYAAAAAAGCDHVVHVSTAYVAARRPGPVPEDPVRDDVDWRVEAAAAEALAERVELASRQPARLARWRERARREVGAHGDEALGHETERLRTDWVERQLVDAGRERARSLGFADVYTLTKALGERVAEERFGAARLSIVRPSIVESSLRHPHPGWIEGFKVADPLMIGLGRGDIPEFPGFPDSVVDVVPVDFVANAVLVAAASPPPTGRPARVVVGTGARNPLHLTRMYALVRGYFDQHPLPGVDGSPTLPTWRFPGVDQVERQLKAATTLSRTAAGLLRRVPVTGTRLRRWGRELDRHEQRYENLTRFLELYGIYAQTEATFLDDTAQALRDGLEGADREHFGFDPTDIDWRVYLTEIHVPSVAAWFRGRQPSGPKPHKPPPALGPATSASRSPRTAADGAKADGAQAEADTEVEAPTVLAVFDLDGTVASTNVLTAYLRARWHDDRVAGLREAADVLRGLPRYLALDAAGRDRFLRAFYQRFAGADVAALDQLVADELGRRILADLSPAAVRRIRAHRDQGHRTVLLTGALRSFCTPLEQLFDDIAAAELEVDATGRATGHLASPPLVGPARAAWLREHARRVGADLGASYAYADSRSDAPMLRVVGHPVAVDPDGPLYRLARRERWAIADWRDAERAPAHLRASAPGPVRDEQSPAEVG